MAMSLRILAPCRALTGTPFSLLRQTRCAVYGAQRASALIRRQSISTASPRWYVAKEGAATSLRQALTQELMYESENPAEPDDWAQYFAKHEWILKEYPGNRSVTLQKSDDRDSISVKISIVDPPADTDLREDNATELIPFTVNVTKQYGHIDHGTLTFELSTRDGDMNILSVYHYPDSKVALSDDAVSEVQRLSAYPGPMVDELDEELVEKFINYLSSIGIDQEFSIMLEHLYYDKEQREYEHWIDSICKFLSK